jgi:hypothetical protein
VTFYDRERLAHNSDKNSSPAKMISSSDGYGWDNPRAKSGNVLIRYPWHSWGRQAQTAARAAWRGGHRVSGTRYESEASFVLVATDADLLPHAGTGHFGRRLTAG